MHEDIYQQYNSHNGVHVDIHSRPVEGMKNVEGKARLFDLYKFYFIYILLISCKSSSVRFTETEVKKITQTINS